VEFLERKDIVFIGRNVGLDVGNLKKQYGVNVMVGSCRDLALVAKQKGLDIPGNKCSLRLLAKTVLQVNLSKAERLSNWDGTLTDNEKRYAAGDVIVALQIYQKLLVKGKEGQMITADDIREGLEIFVMRNKSSEHRVARGVVKKFLSKSKVVVEIRDVIATSLKSRQGKLYEVGTTTEILINCLRFGPSSLDEKAVSPVSAVSDLSLIEFKAETCKEYSRVKLDPFHWLLRVTSTLDKEHGAFYSFSIALRDALFDFDEGDVGRVSKYLKTIGYTFQQKLEENPDWIFKHVRRSIPPVVILEKRLSQVFSTYKNVLDSTTQKLLFHSGMANIIENAMKHVRNGCLSDPVGVQLYFERGYTKAGLMQYRCIRGTNANEGTVHQKLNRQFGAKNAGPCLTYCMLLDFAARNNMKASVRNVKSYNFGHYSPWLIDVVISLTNKVDPDSEIYSEWITFGQLELTDFPDFIMGPYASPNLLRSYDKEFAAENLNESMSFLAKKTNVKIPVLPLTSAAEMKLFVQLKSETKTLAEMLKAWNSHQKCDGNDIFFKLYRHLERHQIKNDRANNRKSTIHHSVAKIVHQKYNKPVQASPTPLLLPEPCGNEAVEIVITSSPPASSNTSNEILLIDNENSNNSNTALNEPEMTSKKRKAMVMESEQTPSNSAVPEPVVTAKKEHTLEAIVDAVLNKKNAKRSNLNRWTCNLEKHLDTKDLTVPLAEFKQSTPYKENKDCTWAQFMKNIGKPNNRGQPKKL
jgi:hypothetical protein